MYTVPIFVRKLFVYLQDRKTWLKVYFKISYKKKVKLVRILALVTAVTNKSVNRFQCRFNEETIFGFCVE